MNKIQAMSIAGTMSYRVKRLKGRIIQIEDNILSYLQQSFFRTKMALNIFQKKFRIELIMVTTLDYNATIDE